MKANIGTLMIGAVTGAVITAACFGIVAISRGLSGWGAIELMTDMDVRHKLESRGIKLPLGASELYYAKSGFVDSTVWIKVCVPTDKIWNLVSDSIQKHEADFVAKFPEHMEKEIYQNRNQKYDLRWWSPTSVQNPLSWSRHTETDGQHYYEDWLIDAKAGIIYVTRWDT